MSEKFERKVITPQEAEKIYGISAGTLANLRIARRGPKFFRAGRRKVIYRVSDFENWLFCHPVETGFEEKKEAD